MHKIALQKIIVLPDFLSADAYMYSKRLFDSVCRSGDIRLIETLLSTVRVLQYQKQFYALELHNLISVLAEHSPRLNVAMIVVAKVYSKPDLINHLLNAVSIQCITQRSASAVPAWHQEMANKNAIKPLFSMRKWSEITNKHRSSVYRRKKKSEVNSGYATVDIQRVLSDVCMPRGNSK